MAVTELALVRVIEPAKISDDSLLKILRHAKLAMEKFSGYEFYFLHCVEDPSLFWICGGWPSVQNHMENWIPSEQNQELVKSLDGKAEVLYMWHVDVEPEKREAVMRSKGISITRNFVKKGEGDRVEEAFGQAKGQSEGSAGEEEEKVVVVVLGGWRIDKGFIKKSEDSDEHQEEGAEWVVFKGWKSKEGFLDIERGEKFQAFAKLAECVDKVDVKHGVLLEI